MQRIRILGAGLAGLTAAINLSKAGYHVDVFERNDDCGKRFYGDIQGLENWSAEHDALEQLQRENIAINFDCTPFTELAVFNGDRRWNFSCNRPAFYLVKRGAIAGSLDWGLKEQALALGVNLHFKATVAKDQVDVVAAGPDPHEIFAVAKGIVFSTSMPDGAFALVNNQAAFKGYAYFLVTGGHGCMCTVLFDDFARLDQCFLTTEQMFAQLIAPEIRNPHPAGGVGSFSLRNTFQQDKSLYAGEAAGLQDLLWGFGMRSAIRSGFLAARSIIDNKPYTSLASACFAKRLKASLVSRFLWETCGGEQYTLIMNAMHRAEDPLRFIGFFHRYTPLHRLLYPLAVRVLRRRYRALRL